MIKTLLRFSTGSLVLAAGLALAPVALAQDGGTPTPPAPGGEGGAPPPPPPGPGGPGGEGRGGRGGRGGMGLPVDRLKEELGLTDDQAAQVEAINREVREKAREMFRSGQGMEGMRGLMDEVWGRVEAILTPEQKPKLAEVKTRMQERMNRMRERGPFGEGGEGGRGGRGGPQLKERLREEALKSLALSQEEAAVVTPKLDTVLETRDLTMREEQRAREEFLTKVRETTDQAALQKLLADYRAAREQGKTQSRQAMDQLRELLTVEQEAKLVGLGILD